MTEENSFKVDHIQKFKQPISILKVAAKLVIVITNNTLFKFTLDNTSKQDEMSLPFSGNEVHSLFIDPTGNHVLVSCKSGLCYYFHKSVFKLKLIKESKDCLVESVGWNRKYSSEQSTGNILLGTKTGHLIETKFSSSVGVDQYWKVISELESNIVGIIFDAYLDGGGCKYFLIIITNTNLYPHYFNFSAPVKQNSVFAAEFERINKQLEGCKCTNFPANLSYSYVDVFYSKNTNFPKYLSWLTGSGVYYAPFNDNSTDAEINLFVRPKLLKFSELFNNSKPFSLANTEFHVILQYSDCLDIVCTLSEKSITSVKSDDLSGELIMSLCKDQNNEIILFYTRQNIYKVNYDLETKYLWKSLLEMKNFKMAYDYCNTPEETNFVKIKEAENCYSMKKYVESAQLYAETNLTFEEVTLKFINVKESNEDSNNKSDRNNDALRTYLLCYSEQKSFSEQGKSKVPKLQNTYDVMCIWMLELFFEQINKDYFINDRIVSNKELKLNNIDYRRFVDQKQVINSLRRNRNLIYEKIKSYGDSCQTALFAEIIEDKEKILECLIDKGNTKQALEILSHEKSVRHHYKHAKILISNHPKEVIDMWIELAPKLDLKLLLPFLREAPDVIAHRFLKHAIFKQQSQLEEIHNAYITLCARLSNKKPKVSSDYTNQLMSYLHEQGMDPFMTKYDVQLALRVCIEWKNLQGSVFIYCLLGKHKDAVEMALEQKHLTLAKSTASQYIGEEEVKKHLWLTIARFIISEGDNMEQVCELIKSQSVLKLEDILPFLPDSVRIEHFSDAICDSLDYYIYHIDNLKKDMELSTEYASKIRDEINLLKQKSITVPAHSVCSYCNEILTIRPFCLFPCKHFFHIHCLEKVIFPMLNNELVQELIDTKQKLMNNPENVELRNAYYKLISEDCCYCGSIAIENIDIPIIGRDEFEMEMEHWN